MLFVSPRRRPEKCLTEEVLGDGTIARVTWSHLRGGDDLRIGVDADVTFVAIETTG